MKQHIARKLHEARRVSWRTWLLYGGVTVVGLCIAVQCVYPANKAVPFAQVNGKPVGGASYDDVRKVATTTHQEQTVALYFDGQTKPYRAPTVAALGATVQADAAAQKVLYPWWLRLVPSSIAWAHSVAGSPHTTATISDDAARDYVVQTFGESCEVAPRNASVAAKDGELSLVPGENGGTCDVSAVVAAIAKADINATAQTKLSLPIQVVAPSISDDEAKVLLQTVKRQLAGGVSVMVDEEAVTLKAEDVVSWLDVVEAEGKPAIAVNAERSDKVLREAFEAKVAKPAGVVTITTHDFAEVSRAGGGPGAALNVAGTGSAIAEYLMAKQPTVTVAITPIEPQKKYIRSYSSTDAGLSALMKNFAEEHPGTYGVSLVELSGQRRRAGFEDGKKFTTASTYKLFVAISVLRRIEAGQMSWSDQISGGRDTAKCFDDMIVLSDNPCAEAFVKKIGYRPLTDDAASIGATSTSFVDKESYKTTAGDLSLAMASLEAGQLPINGDSRARLLSALKRNVYRKGIPAGASGTVADKVGFLDGLLHDTAIVYSPSGTYVLTVMTDGSSWANIAELTRQIETLRAQ